MQIILTVDEAGKINLNCSEDRPWTIVAVLRAAADATIQQHAQQEAAQPKVQLAHTIPAFHGLHNGGK